MYALVMADDWLMCGFNLVGAGACALIAVVATVRQRRFETEMQARGPSSRLL